MFTLPTLLLTALVALQNPPPAPPGEQPGRMGAGEGWQGRAPLPMTQTPNPEVDAWASLLAARLGDKNQDIARSAEMALIALGPQAVPSVSRSAESGSPECVRAARHVLDVLQHGPPRPPPFRPGAGRGPDGPPSPNGPRARDPHAPDGFDGPGPGGPFGPPDAGRGEHRGERRPPPQAGPRGPGPRADRPDGEPRERGPARRPEPRADRPAPLEPPQPPQPPRRDGPI